MTEHQQKTSALLHEIAVRISMQEAEQEQKMKNMRSLWEITADRADILQKQRDAFKSETLTLLGVLVEIQNALSKLNHKPIPNEKFKNGGIAARNEPYPGGHQERVVHSSVELKS